MIDFMASEEDITAILQSPLSHLISDATYPTEGCLIHGCTAPSPGFCSTLSGKRVR